MKTGNLAALVFIPICAGRRAGMWIYMEKIRTTVRIAGKEYTIASTDSEQYVNRVATWVDRRMNELAVATRLPATQLAVLTAVNAADDMMKSRDEIRRLEAELDELRARLGEPVAEVPETPDEPEA